MSHAQSIINSLFKTFREHGSDEDDDDDSKSNDLDNNNDDDYTKEEFAFLACGLSNPDHRHCDLFALIEYILESYSTKEQCIRALNKYGITECDEFIKEKNVENHKFYYIEGYLPLIKMLEKHAPYCENFMKKYLTERESGHLFLHYYKRPALLDKLIQDLPKACKYKIAYDIYDKARNGILKWAKYKDDWSWGKAKNNVEKENQRIARFEDGESKAAFNKAKNLLKSQIYDILINDNSNNKKNNKDIKVWRTRDNVCEIIDQLSEHYPFKMEFKNDSDGKDNNDEDIIDVKGFIEDIKNYIFGYRSPLCESLDNISGIFKLNCDGNRTGGKNVLVVVSDGTSTDGDPVLIAQHLKCNNFLTVNTFIFSCFISADTFEGSIDYSKQKKLFYEKDEKWAQGAQVMFDIASEVHNSDLPISTLLKHNWKVAPEGVSRLFIEGNHEEVNKDFMTIKEKIKDSNDAIIDYIGSYCFDKMIGTKIKGVNYENYKEYLQNERTCYANATAMGLMLAHSRIYRNSPSNEYDFDTLKNQIIKDCGTNGHKTRVAITKYAREWKYFNVRSFNKEEIARGYISQRICLITTMELFDEEWKKFSEFFGNNPTGILTKQGIACTIDKDNNSASKPSKVGHAVLLVRVEPDCLIFVNSWGEEWGDKGFFRIQDECRKSLRMRFWCIEIDETKMDAQDRQDYQQYCENETKRLIDNHIPSPAMYVQYDCPHCGQSTPINQYNGTFIRAICPKCQKTFKPNSKDLIKSLYNHQMSQSCV